MFILLFIIFVLIFIYLYNDFYNYESFEQNSNIKNIANDKLNYISHNQDLINFYFNLSNETKFNSQSNIIPNKDNKIFVSIASYRDPQCPITIKDLLDKADKPENLVIVICQQNDSDDINCFDYSINTNADIKIIKMPYTDARGPCWARYLIQQQWSGEQYYLQIDSHTRFVKSWDTKCINNLNQAIKKTKNNNICLSNYVSTFNINTGEIEVNPLRGPMYIESTDQDDGFFRYNSKYSDKLEEPLESKGWSGCFSFSSSKLIQDAPYDPYTPFLFFGEEMDIFARLYTRGWLMFVPKEPICFTIFDRSYRKTFWEHPDQAETVKLSKFRLYYRFGLIDKNQIELHNLKDIIKEIDKFKLGNKKTFDEFMKYCLE